MLSSGPLPCQAECPIGHLVEDTKQLKGVDFDKRLSTSSAASINVDIPSEHFIRPSHQNFPDIKN